MVYEYGKTNDRKRKRSTQSDDYEKKPFSPVLDLSRNNQNTPNMEDEYETPKDFINRTGREKLFRAIRMMASDKQDPITKYQV